MYDIYLKKAIIMHIYDREILTQYTAVRSNALEAYKTTHIGWFNTFLSVTERIIGRTEGIISSLIPVLLRKPPTRELRNSAEGRYTYFFPYRPVEKKGHLVGLKAWVLGLMKGGGERWRKNRYCVHQLGRAIFSICSQSTSFNNSLLSIYHMLSSVFRY